MQINPIKENQTEIRTTRYVIFFSYKTPVLYRDLESGITYRTAQFWSVTTSKHINKYIQQHGLQNVQTCSQETLDDLLD